MVLLSMDETHWTRAFMRSDLPTTMHLTRQSHQQSHFLQESLDNQVFYIRSPDKEPVALAEIDRPLFCGHDAAVANDPHKNMQFLRRPSDRSEQVDVLRQPLRTLRGERLRP